MADSAAMDAFASGLSGIIAKHKKETISIKAARSWQFRAKKSVNESWAKVLKKKGQTTDALDKLDEEEDNAVYDFFYDHQPLKYTKYVNGPSYK